MEDREVDSIYPAEKPNCVTRQVKLTKQKKNSCALQHLFLNNLCHSHSYTKLCKKKKLLWIENKSFKQKRKL